MSIIILSTDESMSPNVWLCVRNADVCRSWYLLNVVAHASVPSAKRSQIKLPLSNYSIVWLSIFGFHPHKCIQSIWLWIGAPGLDGAIPSLRRLPGSGPVGCGSDALSSGKRDWCGWPVLVDCHSLVSFTQQTRSALESHKDGPWRSHGLPK